MQPAESIYYNTQSLSGSELKQKRKSAAKQEDIILKALKRFEKDYPDGMTCDDLHFEIFFSLKLKQISYLALKAIVHFLGMRNKDRDNFDHLMRLIGDKNGIRRACDTLIGNGKIKRVGKKKGTYGTDIYLHKIID